MLRFIPAVCVSVFKLLQERQYFVTILTLRVIFSWSMTFGAQHQLQVSQIAIYNTQLTIILVDTGILQEFSVVGYHNCSCHS